MARARPGAGGGRGLSEESEAPPRARPFHAPPPAAADASLCCLMRDKQARGVHMHLSARDSGSLQAFPLAR